MQRVVCANHPNNDAALFCIDCATHQVACLRCIEQHQEHFGHRVVSLDDGRRIAHQHCVDSVATVNNAEKHMSQADRRWRRLNRKLLHDATHSVQELDTSIVKLIEQLEQVRVSLHTAVQRAAQTARSKCDKWSKQDKQKHTNTIRRATSWAKHLQTVLNTATVSELLYIHATTPEVSECVGVDEQAVEYERAEHLNGLGEKVKDSLKAVAEGVHRLRELSEELFVRPDKDAAEQSLMNFNRTEVVLLAGSYNASNSYVFNPATNTWSTAACMSESRWLAAAALWNGKVVVAGGSNNNYGAINSAEQYDPDTNQWSAFKPMLTCREGLGLVVFRNSLFAVGGYDGKQYLSSVERYDAEKNEWTLAPALRQLRAYAGVACSAQVILVCGGEVINQRLKTCELLDGAVSQWKQCASLSSVRTGGSAASYNDKFYVFGGWDGRVHLDSIEEYDYEIDTWTVLSARLSVPRRLTAAACAGGRVFVCGGFNGSSFSLPEVDSWDLKAFSLTSVAPLPAALNGAAAVSFHVSAVALGAI